MAKGETAVNRDVESGGSVITKRLYIDIKQVFKKNIRINRAQILLGPHP